MNLEAAELLAVRLWSSVRVPNRRGWHEQCWLWTGATRTVSEAKGKRGVLRIGDTELAAHKLAYAVFHNIALAMVPSLVVEHACGAGLCCNPTHLVLDEDNRVGRICAARAELAAVSMEDVLMPPRQPVSAQRAGHIVRDYLFSNMSHREVMELHGINRWQLDDLIRRIKAGEFRMKRDTVELASIPGV